MVPEFTTDEGIPLTEDVIKRPPREFSATLSEWAADNIEQIVLNCSINAVDVNIYVVPDNFTLFITNAFISVACTGGAGRRIARISINGTSNDILNAQIVASQANAHISMIFPMPIKVTAKNLVNAGMSTGALALVGFAGFLLPKKISIR